MMGITITKTTPAVFCIVALLLVFSPFSSSVSSSTLSSENSGSESGCAGVTSPDAADGGTAAENRCPAPQVDEASAAPAAAATSKIPAEEDAETTLSLVQKKTEVRRRGHRQSLHFSKNAHARQDRTTARGRRSAPAPASSDDPDCQDDDEEIVAQAAEYCERNGEGCEVSACVDVGGYCSREDGDKVGDLVKATCCATCKGVPLPEDSLPPADETVSVFVLGGQSECVGAASADGLPRSRYPMLHGPKNGAGQENVWFAGYAEPAMSSRFFLAPMKPGQEKTKFGAEMGLGQRLHEVTQEPVLIVKYCWGGTNVETNWNPETKANRWNRDADDGSANWLLTEGGVDFSDINALYKNLIYTVRRAVEKLSDSGIPYEYKGIFWVQGQADALRSWDQYGEDLARVWDNLRDDLDQPELPIVDTGASLKNNLRSGKAYAGSLVSGCKVKTVEFALASENPACVPRPGDACVDYTYWNYEVFNHYGYDPRFKIRPDGYDGDAPVFKWWITFPKNSHSQYDGMVLMGRMLGDAYIDSFREDVDVPQDMAAEDAAFQFPWDPCPEGEEPSAESICWKDQRDDDAKALEANCA